MELQSYDITKGRQPYSCPGLDRMENLAAFRLLSAALYFVWRLVCCLLWPERVWLIY